MNNTTRSNSVNLSGAQSPDAEENTLSKPRSQDSGIVARATLVVVLSLTLVGAMRWALNITNANARQISTNLTRMQGQYDTQARSGARKSGDFPSRRSADGPIIEPDTR